MFHGGIYWSTESRNGISSQTPNLLFCSFAEGERILFNKTKTFNIEEHLKQTFTKEVEFSHTLGYYHDKSIFVAHSNCQGRNCPCWLLAKNYLFNFPDLDVPDYLTQVYQPNKEVLNSPLLMLFHKENTLYSLISYGSSDIRISQLPSGFYQVRDIFLQKASEDTYSIMKSFIESNYSEMWNEKVLNHLADQNQGWPKPSGYGYTIIRTNEMNIFKRSNCPCSDEKSEISKPKGPITGFNFFSKINRNSILTQLGSETTNNELNRILGQKWKEMTHKDRLPYLEHAERDKERYHKELYEKGASYSEGSKPMSAYNHFIHQEKQFILALEVGDSQTKIGKHGSDRWTEMDQEEKNLYIILHQADVQYQNKFFKK